MSLANCVVCRFFLKHVGCNSYGAFFLYLKDFCFPFDFSNFYVHVSLFNNLILQDIVSEHPERFFVAEILREKIFIQYRQEIPYVCQVI